METMTRRLKKKAATRTKTPTLKMFKAAAPTETVMKMSLSRRCELTSTLLVLSVHHGIGEQADGNEDGGAGTTGNGGGNGVGSADSDQGNTAGAVGHAPDANQGPTGENLVLALAKNMQEELLQYEIPPEDAPIVFYKEMVRVMFETKRFTAEQSGDSDVPGDKVSLKKYDIVRCKNTGYYFMVADFFKPMLGFAVADGGGPKSLKREHDGDTLS
eukprot:6180732-Pleurochrysis_carterae.AAC.1